MKRKDVVISIRGLQQIDGELDTVELETCGRYAMENGGYCISYDESETTGFAGSHTTLKIDQARRQVTMRRSGKTNSQLIVEKGRRHQCLYDTGFGPVTIGISGGAVRCTLDETGGELDFSYSMDINAALASENRVIIRVKECNTSC